MSPLPPLLPTTLPPFLSSLRKRLPRPSAPVLLALVTTTTPSQADIALPIIYHHFARRLPPAPPVRSRSPVLPSDDPVPRRVLVREAKEALVKSAILIGVPKAIGALVRLDEVVEEGARDDGFVREGLGRGEWGAEVVMQRGEKGFKRIDGEGARSTGERMGPDGRELAWLTHQLTYGTFLTPHPPPAPSAPSRDPLAHDPALLSVVTLSALIPQGTPREIASHLRGALRNGMDREEVAMVQESVEELCGVCGVAGLGDGMPRVADVV